MPLIRSLCALYKVCQSIHQSILDDNPSWTMTFSGVARSQQRNRKPSHLQSINPSILSVSISSFLCLRLYIYIQRGMHRVSSGIKIQVSSGIKIQAIAKFLKYNLNTYSVSFLLTMVRLCIHSAGIHGISSGIESQVFSKILKCDVNTYVTCIFFQRQCYQIPRSHRPLVAKGDECLSCRQAKLCRIHASRVLCVCVCV